MEIRYPEYFQVKCYNGNSVRLWIISVCVKKYQQSPEQEEDVLIAKSQPLQSQDLAINPEPSMPQNLNPPKEEKIQPLEIPFEIS